MSILIGRIFFFSAPFLAHSLSYRIDLLLAAYFNNVILNLIESDKFVTRDLFNILLPIYKMITNDKTP